MAEPDGKMELVTHMRVVQVPGGLVLSGSKFASLDLVLNQVETEVFLDVVTASYEGQDGEAKLQSANAALSRKVEKERQTLGLFPWESLANGVLIQVLLARQKHRENAFTFLTPLRTGGVGSPEAVLQEMVFSDTPTPDSQAPPISLLPGQEPYNTISFTSSAFPTVGSTFTSSPIGSEVARH